MTSINQSPSFSLERAPSARPLTKLVTSVASDVASNAVSLVDLKTVAKNGFQKQAAVGADLEKIDRKIDESVQHLNSMLKDNSTALNMSMDRVLGAPVVTVRDLESGEVIRQIPNEVVVKLAHSLEAFKGWLHDGKA